MRTGDETAAFHQHLRRELKAGGDALAALAATRRSLAATRFVADGRNYSRAHPFFWAPFVMVGD